MLCSPSVATQAAASSGQCSFDQCCSPASLAAAPAALAAASSYSGSGARGVEGWDGGATTMPVMRVLQFQQESTIPPRLQTTTFLKVPAGGFRANCGEGVVGEVSVQPRGHPWSSWVGWDEKGKAVLWIVIRTSKLTRSTKGDKSKQKNDTAVQRCQPAEFPLPLPLARSPTRLRANLQKNSVTVCPVLTDSVAHHHKRYGKHATTPQQAVL